MSESKRNVRPSLGAFSPALRRLFAATVVNMIGSGMLFAFVFIYLDDVRGFSSGRAGLAVGATPLFTVVSTPSAGWLSDRFGPRRILTIGCLLAIVAGLAYVWVETFPEAVAVGALLGVANGLWWPSQSALLSVIVSPELRPSVAAFQRTALNIGAALGGVAAGFIVDRNDLASFQRMFVINVVTYIVFLGCLPGLPSGRLPREEQGDLGFRAVVGDRFFVKLLASDLGVAFAFGFLFAVMPAYATKIGIRESVIGILFTLGAATVVVFQIPMLGWVRGRSRMRSLAVMNALFVAAFVVTSFSATSPWSRAVVLIGLGQVVGGVGECVLGAIRQPLTSDLAPRELVGRYFGLAGMVFQGGMGAANAIGGALMDVSLRAIWLVGAGIAVYGLALSLRLDRDIPERLRFSA